VSCYLSCLKSETPMLDQSTLSKQKLDVCQQYTPVKKRMVSDLESGDFSSWQGNQGIVRRRTQVRRTNKPDD